VLQILGVGARLDADEVQAPVGEVGVWRHPRGGLRTPARHDRSVDAHEPVLQGPPSRVCGRPDTRDVIQMSLNSHNHKTDKVYDQQAMLGEVDYSFQQHVPNSL
jgi:hypothetical protein